MVEQPVEDGGGQDRVAENLPPLAKALMTAAHGSHASACEKSAAVAKIGWLPSKNTRTTYAIVLATMTGRTLRGRHSKSRSSTARNSEEIGAPKVADMPAAAPATSKMRRSMDDRGSRWARSDPKGPRS